MFWLRVSWGYNRNIGQDCSHAIIWRSPWAKKSAWTVAHSHAWQVGVSCWQDSCGALQMSLSMGYLTVLSTWRLASPRARVEIKVAAFFLLPSLKSHTLSFLPYHWLPRSALFSVGGNYKKAWRLKGKNYLWQSWRLDATWGNIRPYRFFIVQSTYSWDSCLYYLSSPQVLPCLNFWRTSSRLSYLGDGSYSILYSSSLRITTSSEFFCVLHYTKCRTESIDGVQKFLLNNKRLIFVPSHIMWEFQNSKLSQEFSLSYKDKSFHNFQNYLSYL